MRKSGKLGAATIRGGTRCNFFRYLSQKSDFQVTPQRVQLTRKLFYAASNPLLSGWAQEWRWDSTGRLLLNRVQGAAVGRGDGTSEPIQTFDSDAWVVSEPFLEYFC